MKLSAAVLTVLLVAPVALPAGASVEGPRNFDVFVHREDVWVTKNGKRWDWQGEEYAKHMEGYFRQYWQRPIVYSFRGGRVIAKHEYRIDDNYQGTDTSSWSIGKEVTEGTFDGTRFSGRFTKYIEHFCRTGDTRYPSGNSGRGWYGGTVSGNVDAGGVLLLKVTFDWDRWLSREWVPVNNAEGTWVRSVFGGWKRTPTYEQEDIYAVFAKLRLPAGRRYDRKLVTQPGFVIEDPNKAVKGVPVDEDAPAVGGGFGAPAGGPGQPSGEPAKDAGMKRKADAGPVEFASGIEVPPVADERDRPSVSPGERGAAGERASGEEAVTPPGRQDAGSAASFFPMDWDEETREAAAGAAGAAAAGGAAALGALAMMGASGVRPREVLEGAAKLLGGKAAPDSIEDWEEKYRSLGWEYDDDAGGFVPKEGAVSENGKVWMASPCEEEPGRSVWMDREEADQIRQRRAAGEVCGPSYGWEGQEARDALDAKNARERSDEHRSQQHAGPEGAVERDMERCRQTDEGCLRRQRDMRAIEEFEKESSRSGMAFERKMAAHELRYERTLALVQAGADAVKTTCDTVINTVGAIPGGTRCVKWGYSAVTESADTYIETGSLTETAGTALTSLGQDAAGGLTGDTWNVPGVDDLPGIGGAAVFEIVERTGAGEVGQLSATVLKGKVVSGSVNPVIGEAGEALFEQDEWPAEPVKHEAPQDYAPQDAAGEGEDASGEREDGGPDEERPFYGEEEWEAAGDDKTSGPTDDGGGGNDDADQEEDEENSFTWL